MSVRDTSMNIKEIVESQEPPEGSLAAQLMAAARSRGMNPRIRGTPEEERARTHATLAQRAKDRLKANKIDPAELAKIEAELAEIVKTYKSLGGSNWQYADREQNLTDAERRARDLETSINNLHRRIAAHKEANAANLDEAVGEPVKYGMPGFGDRQVDETIVKRGSGYQVKSKSGKNLGSSPTKKGALKRMGQVEYFKHHPGK